MNEWIDIKERKPAESGYYMTYYQHETLGRLFKAFWYSVPQDKWIFRRFTPAIIAWHDIRHDFYCPCMGQTGAPELPDKYL